MARDKSRAHRTDLPRPTEEQQEPEVEPPEEFPFILEAYIADCFVDSNLMIATNSCVARGYFIDQVGREVRVHVPTTSFFQLHTQDPNAPYLWDCLNLAPYFALPPWCPDFRRAWALVCTLDSRFRFTVLDLQGRQREFTLTRDMVRGAFQLVTGDLPYNDKAYTEEERALCSSADHPTWDQLNHQQIRLPLQIHTQHLQITYPHRWTTMEKIIAIEYTRRQVNRSPVDFEYTGSWIEKLQKAAKSMITQSKSMAKRQMKPYLGAVLALTRIVYYALGCINELPKPWEVPAGAEVESKITPCKK